MKKTIVGKNPNRSEHLWSHLSLFMSLFVVFVGVAALSIYFLLGSKIMAIILNK